MKNVIFLLFLLLLLGLELVTPKEYWKEKINNLTKIDEK